MNKKWKIILAIFIGVTLIGLTFVGLIMSDVEQEKYSVVHQYQDNIEIRKYEPKLIAQVTVNGERHKAISEGFKQIADYIFGNNIEHNKIAMTAPVTQTKYEHSWVVYFTMPSSYTIKTIPKPVNNNVTLKEVPQKIIASITFSGTSSQENIAEYEAKLRNFLQINNLNSVSDVSYAFYNPPWTLPPLRRNEVMFEIENIIK
jgi:effector-binding domain-containing protein